jgi:hypothetical protein
MLLFDVHMDELCAKIPSSRSTSNRHNPLCRNGWASRNGLPTTGRAEVQRGRSKLYKLSSECPQFVTMAVKRPERLATNRELTSPKKKRSLRTFFLRLVTVQSFSTQTGDFAMTEQMSKFTTALAAPFEVNEVKFKPQSVKGNRALALAYIDCRVIQDRLDDVLGIENWMDEYEVLNDGSVICRLKLKFGDQWVTKTDVGSPSEQPDPGDRLKAAFSDAMKRAAVKFGIGRYLYRLSATWADYDPQKRQFSQAPQLPNWALPKRPDPAVSPATTKTTALPNNGEELHRRLREYDAKLASKQLCGVGALLSHVTQEGVKAGFGEDIRVWDSGAISFAVNAVKIFESGLKSNEISAKSAA